MSRAFVKEPDGNQVDDELPERPRSPHPNYVTPAGLRQLHARIKKLAEERARLQSAGERLAEKNQLRLVERDLRHVEQGLKRAILVDPAAQPRSDIRFGAEVEVLDEQGERHRFRIVGEDEACAPKGYISWVSPLARALLGKRVGDVVNWEHPAGNVELEVVEVDYPPT